MDIAHMTITASVPTMLFWLANVFFTLAYVIRSMFWLRVFTIIACATTFPYYYFQPEPLLSAVAWEVVFIAINAYNLFDLWSKQRPVVLTPEQQMLHLRALPNFSPREMLALLEQADSKQVAAGELVSRRGMVNTELILVVEGELDVVATEQIIARITHGAFVGEMSFVTGEMTSADVRAASPTRYLSWQKEPLDRYLAKNQDIASLLQGALGRDMANKIKAHSAGGELGVAAA